MAIHELVRTEDVGSDGITEYYIRPADRPYAGETVTDRKDFTLEELADYCDSHAEGRNAHDFVGAHRILAAYLHRELGRESATRLMLGIAQRDGVDGMAGVCGTDSCFEEFGIKDAWYDWKLPD